MKTKLILSLLMLQSVVLFSQHRNWSDPIFLTDSLSDNTNCTIATIPFWYDDIKIFVFWEKSTDSSSTSIYYKNLTDMGEQQLAISLNNVHLKNPKILKTYHYPNYIDDLFILIFESNQNSNVDLYYSVYSSEGVFSEPEQLTESLYDDKNLSVGSDNKEIVWEQDGKILNSKFIRNDSTFTFSDPIIVDSNECSKPAIGSSERIVFYEKIIDDTLKIFFSEWNYIHSQWDTPEMLFFPGENISPTLNSYEDYNIYPVCWQFMQDSLWDLCFCDSYHEIYTVDLMPNYTKTSPSFIQYYISPKNKFFEMEYLLMTFVSDSTDNQEVYVHENENWPGYLINLSNYEGIDRNPLLFGTEIYPYSIHAINIWESYRNKHWLLVMSDTIIPIRPGGVNDNIKTQETFVLQQNYPNPLNTETIIKYEIHKPAKINLSIFNISGQKIKTLIDKNQSAGEYFVEWDGTDYNCNKVPNGIYFYKLSIGKQTTTKTMSLIR